MADTTARFGDAHVYAIALGSNRRHHRHGKPRAIVAAALDAIGHAGCEVMAVSCTLDSAPLGPSRRRFANAAAIIGSPLNPASLLAVLKSIERRFGRRPGMRWAARVLDLDIILWSGGMWHAEDLVVPHPHWRARVFVLEPLAEIAPDWRDPVTNRTVQQLLHRLKRRVSWPQHA